MNICGFAKKLLPGGVIALALAPALLAQAPAPTVFATGFNNPRGLKFGPDGYLYVAEGGAGGSSSTQGICPQVPTPVGPYTGGYTARISKVAPDGTVSTVVDNLPSNQTSPANGTAGKRSCRRRVHWANAIRDFSGSRMLSRPCWYGQCRASCECRWQHDDDCRSVGVSKETPGPES